MTIEAFFDLRIATLAPREPAPDDADIARVIEPPPDELECRGSAWFYKPRYVTWRIATPPSIEAHLACFRPDARREAKRMLREVPRRFRLEIDPDSRRLGEFTNLYRSTTVARPRGIDRLAERPGRKRLGLHLFEGETMVAGVLVHRFRTHLSVSYGAFRPELRRFELEHYLILQTLQRAIELGKREMSLGRDTNLYGHHLSLHLPVYKRRIGFRPMPDEAGGRELFRLLRLDRFERGAFFYSFDGSGGLRGEVYGTDPRPFGKPVREWTNL